MSQNNNIRLRRCIDIVLSVAIIATGLFFMLGCLNIYFSGDAPYSRDSVAREFNNFDAAVYFTIILAVVSMIVDLIFPVTIKNKPIRSYSNTVHILKMRKDVSSADEKLLVMINKERQKRKLNSIIRNALVIISCAVFLTYSLNINNFHKSDIDGSMINAMFVLVPCFIVPFAYAVFTAYYSERSFKREAELLKELPNKESVETAPSEKNRSILRIVIIAVAAAILLYGFFSGGTADVLTKAINICTECIGLG